MNKKKITAALVIVMVLQLVICCLLISYDKIYRDAVISNGTEYKFAVSHFYISPDEENNELYIDFPTRDINDDYSYGSQYYREIEVGEDSLARIVGKYRDGNGQSPAYDIPAGYYSDKYTLKVDDETLTDLGMYSRFIDEFYYYSGFVVFDKSAEYMQYLNEIKNEKLRGLGMKQIASNNREELLDCYVTALEYKGKYIFKDFYIAGMLVAELEF